MRRCLILLLTVICLMSFLPETSLAAAPQDGHVYVYVKEKSQNATCTQDGFAYYECVNHAEIFYTETIPALGHKMEKDIEIKADCTHAHVLIHICGRCDYTQRETIGPATGHSYEKKTIQKATETREGIVEYTCTRCDHSYRETIPKTEVGAQSQTRSELDLQEAGVQDLQELTEIQADLTQTDDAKPVATIKDSGDDGSKGVRYLNYALLTVGIVEIIVFFLLIFKDITVLKWHNDKRKAALQKNASKT